MNLGWSISNEDYDLLEQDSIQLPATFGASVANAPSDFDVRMFVNVEDQRNLNSCVGHAASSGVEFIRWFRDSDEQTQLSPMFAYLSSQHWTRPNPLSSDQQGSTISGAAQALKLWGCCPESDFPYPNSYSPPNPAILTPARITAAKPNKIQHWSRLKSDSEIWNWLKGFGAVLVGVSNWDDRLANLKAGDWRNDKKSGTILHATVKGTKIAPLGHAVVLMGWSFDGRDNTQYPLLLNSHWRNWGNNGWARVHPDALKFWVDNPNNVFIGITDVNDPTLPARNWG